MAAPDPSPKTQDPPGPRAARSGGKILLEAFILAVGLFVHAEWLRRHIPPPAAPRAEGSPAPAAPESEPKPAPDASSGGPAPVTASPRGPALASLPDGRVLYADGSGYLFVLRAEGSKLVLDRTYELVHDSARARYGTDGQRLDDRYLDDVAERQSARLARLRWRFEEIVSSTRADAKAVEEAQDLARELADAGDIPYLAGRVRAGEYLSRRSAAVALAERRYRVAAEFLLEILSGDASETRLAAEALGRLTGLDAASLTPEQVWAWLDRHPLTHPHARVLEEPR